MMRRRSTPWIHRWSRQLLGAVAVLGVLDTTYLTYLKLSGNPATCPITQSCDRVLTSPYAEVVGIPLPFLGLLAYISMAIFALVPLAINSDSQRELRSQLEEWSWLLLFAGGTAMAIFSGYLMYLLFFKIGGLCIYCLASAFFSATLFLLAIVGRSWDDIGQIVFIGIVVGMVTLIGTLGVYSLAEGPAPGTPGKNIPAITGSPEPTKGGWPITTDSGPAELALAEHLTATGAKMYGAYWCPHCHEQKLLLGKEAFSKINYIECAPEAKNPQPKVCEQAGITSFPTWEINGKLEKGVQEGEKLGQLSGYQGKTNFKYSLGKR